MGNPSSAAYNALMYLYLYVSLAKCFLYRRHKLSAGCGASVTCIIEADAFDRSEPIPFIPTEKCLLVFIVTLFIFAFQHLRIDRTYSVLSSSLCSVRAFIQELLPLNH